jgi:hypothetical protein
MKRPAISSAILAAALTVGCVQDRTALEPFEAAFNKGKGGSGDGTVSSDCGGQTALRDSRASLNWEGSIRDDGRGAFVGDESGVHAKIFYHDGNCSRSGDLVFDADMNAKGSNRRHLTFHFPADNDLNLPAHATAAPFINFRAIQFLGSDIGVPGAIDGRDAKVEEKDPGAPRGWEYPSASAERPDYPTFNGTTEARSLRIDAGLPGCDLLRIEKIRMTRTGGVNGFRATGGSVNGAPLGAWSHLEADLGAWMVETVETENSAGQTGHWAQCEVTGQGGGVRTPNGSPMHMPFTVTVAERRP